MSDTTQCPIDCIVAIRDEERRDADWKAEITAQLIADGWINLEADR